MALRIGLILQGGTAWVGGTEYIKNIAKALYAVANRQRLQVVPIAPWPVQADLYADMPAEFFSNLVTSSNVPAKPRPYLDRCWTALVRRLFATPLVLSSELIDQANVDFLYPYLSLPWHRGPRSAAWIQDFQHHYYPEFFSPTERWQRHREFRQIARQATQIVLSSEAARRDFVRSHPRHQAKARVLRFRTVTGSDWLTGDPKTVQHRYGLPDRFFIVCNQFWQHKNHRVVFEAVRLLKERGLRVVVACTGNLADYRNTSYLGQLRHCLHEWNIADQVHLLGLIARHDQIQLVRRALAVIQPSLFEGWSTVVEDARCLGKHLVLSDIAVHREQDPPRAAFFQPADARELARVLANWWEQGTPGPELGQERRAFEQNRKDVDQFADRFLALARSAA